MRRALTDGAPGTEFWQTFLDFERSAWRWEHQPAYHIGYEHQQFDDFLDGRPQPPTDNPDLGEWMGQVERQVAEGKSIGRVRIVDQPPTDYQRWMQWLDRWNREAGEVIHYLTRSAARQAGLPVDDRIDFWLFDDTRLVLMHHDSQGRRVKVEMVVDEPEVTAARRLRQVALRAALE